MKCYIIILFLVGFVGLNILLSNISLVEALPASRIITKDAYGNEVMPVLDMPIFFHYNLHNYEQRQTSYELEISISNDDINKQIFYKTQQLSLEPQEQTNVIWGFTPTKPGNYSAKVTKNDITIGNGFTVYENSKPMILDPEDATGILSPIKQTKFGISPDDIWCKRSFKLIQKYDGSPACVKLSTAIKLYDRGWTNPLTTYFSFCGEDGFSKGNLNKSNSTHLWDENMCEWKEIRHEENEK